MLHRVPCHWAETLAAKELHEFMIQLMHGSAIHIDNQKSRLLEEMDFSTLPVITQRLSFLFEFFNENITNLYMQGQQREVLICLIIEVFRKSMSSHTEPQLTRQYYEKMAKVIKSIMADKRNSEHARSVTRDLLFNPIIMKHGTLNAAVKCVRKELSDVTCPVIAKRMVHSLRTDMLRASTYSITDYMTLLITKNSDTVEAICEELVDTEHGLFSENEKKKFQSWEYSVSVTNAAKKFIDFFVKSEDNGENTCLFFATLVATIPFVCSMVPVRWREWEDRFAFMTVVDLWLSWKDTQKRMRKNMKFFEATFDQLTSLNDTMEEERIIALYLA